MGKLELNKKRKKSALYNTAFELFTTKGLAKTTISDIVENAGVAKGTFYLYFKDKYDIRNHLISHKASQVFLTAYNELQKHEEICDFEDQVLFIIDNILDQFAENHSLVMLISKHLSWGFFTNSLIESPDKDVPAVYTIYQELLAKSTHTYQDPELMMYMILELVSGVSYNTILYQQPLPLDKIKEPLYKVLKSIFKQYRTEE